MKPKRADASAADAFLGAEDYHRAANILTIKSQTLPCSRALASGEIAALMGACSRDASPAGIRYDAALIAVLYGAGLRRSESVGLDLSDYNVETGELAYGVVLRDGNATRAAELGPRFEVVSFLVEDLNPIVRPVADK